jgi:adenylate kinase
MLEVTGLRDKDSIESLSSEERTNMILQIRPLIERYFVRDCTKSFTLLENHLTIVREGVVVVPSREIYLRFNLAGLCVVYLSDPKTLLERRESDIFRRRPKENVSLILAQQAANEIEARAIAEQYGIPMKMLENRPGALPVDEAKEWVKTLVSQSTHGEDQRNALL